MQFFAALFLVHFVFSHEHSENEKQDIITTDQQAKAASQVKQLSGRSFSRRKSLPQGNMFSGRSVDSLRCGETYSVAKEGHYIFNLNPRKQPCAYDFLGSRTEKCTVAILCNEKITLAPPSSAGCEQEWLVLSDGTEGLMSGCGTFTFSNTPRIPRNNGSDLYFQLKGSSSSRCIAFCNEELTSAQTGLQKARKISRNKKYQGYQMENECKCGIRKNVGRIVGGENAFKFEFPWIGAIVFKGSMNKRKPFCGGSLVGDRYFISAAHCFAIETVSPNEIQVVLHAHVMDRRFRGSPDDSKYQKVPGWNLPEETDESENSVRMDVQEIINHPLFDDRTFDYDIAILKFTRAVNLKKGKVAPICLPYMHEFFPFEDGTDMVVAGWGRPWEDAPAGSRLLQKLDVPYLNLDDCYRYTVPTKRHLCAGYIEGGKDACAGDSGGPLMYQFNPDESQYFLSGIVSAGAGCARRNNLGLYTDVQELLQWTYLHMPGAIYCPRSRE